MAKLAQAADARQLGNASNHAMGNIYHLIRIAGYCRSEPTQRYDWGKRGLREEERPKPCGACIECTKSLTLCASFTYHTSIQICVRIEVHFGLLKG